MTTLTNRAAAFPGIPHSPAHHIVATIAKRFHALRAARKAARLQRHTEIILSGLEPRLLRDIGLNPTQAAERDPNRHAGPPATYGLW